MEENKKKAGWFFHHREYNYNCAQAIVHCWSKEANLVSEMERFGGGKALNGQCGALFAAKHVTAELNLDVEKVEQLFVEKAGSFKCREIRSKKIFSCQQCVDVADEILEELVAQRDSKTLNE
jgi:hypothetical protein